MCVSEILFKGSVQKFAAPKPHKAGVGLHEKFVTCFIRFFMCPPAFWCFLGCTAGDGQYNEMGGGHKLWHK